MIALPPDVLALLDEGRITIRGLMKFVFGTGTYGFIKAVQPFPYGGVTYQPGGIIQVSDLAAETGLTAQQFTITLAASPDDVLTPAVLQTIEAEDYRDRPVTIYDAYFHPDTNALLFVQAMKRGYVDVIDHVENQSAGYTIVASCETRALDYTRTNGRKRSVADQNRRFAGDKWFNHSAMRGREKIWWGQEKPSSSTAMNGQGQFLGGGNFGLK